MAGTAVVVSLAGGVVATRVNWTDLEVIGIDDGQQLQRKDLSELRLRIVAGGPAAGAVRVTLNGTDVPVTEAQRGEALITSRKALVDAIRPGKNTYVVRLGGRYMLGGERIERTFDFDPSGPTLMLPQAVVDPGNGEVISMRGIANDTASLRANGQAIPLGEGGGFQLDVAPGASEVVLVAKDKDGNPSRTVLPVATADSKPAYPNTAAVHITAAGWSDPTLRAGVIELVKSGRINAVQLDIKDEGGEVGYLSDVPLAKKIGATRDLYDPEQAIKELHDLDVRASGAS
ncbi:MAG: putative glycoside hydrolase [Ilumatobacteraceae bacterium]